MNRLKEGLKSFLYDSRKRRARSAAAVILAAAVVFSVFGGLVRPAVSMTDGPGYTSLRGANDGGYPADMPAGLADGALVIGKSESSEATGIYEVTSTVSNDTVDPDNQLVKYFAEMLISFNLTADTVALIRSQYGDSIKFALDVKDNNNPDNPTIELFDGMKLSDDVYPGRNSREKIGKYYIDPIAKEVTIWFDFESTYLKEREGSSIDGGFNLQTWVWDENNSTEDKRYELAGSDVTVPIYRYTHQPDLNVTKTYNNDFFEGTQGDTMQGRSSLGSSFNIDITSNNGIKENYIDITDSLISDSVHIDLSTASNVKLYDLNDQPITTDYPKLVIEEVTTAGSGSTLKAKLVAGPDGGQSDLFERGFSYRFKCPVAVNDEYIGPDGAVHVTEDFTNIDGTNTVEVRTPTVSKKTAKDKIHVNLLADIAKDNGTYNPEDNTITWTYGIFKNNGWWINGEINVDDLIGGPDGEVPDIVPGSWNLEVATSSGKENEDDDREQLIYEAPDAATNGVSGFTYNADTGRFTIDMVTEEWEGKTYNKTPVKAFRVTYKTNVTAEDYGTTVTNWVGMRDPDEPEDSDKKYNWTDQGTSPVAKPSLSKSGTLGDDGITWTIKVTNTAGQDLEGLKISDLLTRTGGTPDQIDLSTATVNGSAITSVFNVEDSQLVFKTGSTAAEYTVTYEQELTGDAMTAARGDSFTNEATLKTPDDTELDKKSDTVHIPQQFEVIKEGVLSADGKMTYTVTFVNQYGAQLNGMTIDDTLTIVGPNGAAVNASDYVLTVVSPTEGVTANTTADGNTLTTAFTVSENTTAQRYTVTYTVKPVSGSFMGQTGTQLNNTAQWRDQPDAHDSNYKTIEKFVSLGNKDGSYNQRSNTVTWTVTVNNPYGVDLGTYPTADEPYKLYDTLFGDGSVVSFKVFDASGADVTAAGDLAAVNSSRKRTSFSENILRSFT